MKLKPMRTRSKRAPKIKGKNLNTDSNQPLISLEETKEMIREKLLLDERKIRIRNPKKHVVSEEKWLEGTNWSDIIQEGEKRDKGGFDGGRKKSNTSEVGG